MEATEKVRLQNQKLLHSSKVYKIQMEEFNPEVDDLFVKKILAPYFSSVYFGLIARQKKEYLTIERTELYLGMPKYISQRLV